MSTLRAPTFIVLTLVVSLAVTDAVLAPAPAPARPDFIDTVLASKAVVAAIRISILFATLFIALSVIALAAQRRWLTRVGPVEASDLRAGNQQLEEELEAAHRVIESLESKAAHTQQVVDREQGI